MLILLFYGEQGQAYVPTSNVTSVLTLPVDCQLAGHENCQEGSISQMDRSMFKTVFRE